MPGDQGRGVRKNASSEMLITASAVSAIVELRDRIVADTMTGAMIRIENGFCSPPVT